MSCPERSNNTVSFTVKKNSTGTVILRFRGDIKKKVSLNWGNGQPPLVYDSCDLDTGVCYSTKFNNQSGSDCSATVNSFYGAGTCPSGSPAANPAINGETLLMVCNPGSQNPNHVVVAAWLLEAPDSSDTIQVTIIVEDDSWLGDGNGEEGEA